MRIIVMERNDVELYAMNEHSSKSIIISIASFGCNVPFIKQASTNGIIDILYLSFNDTETMGGHSGSMVDSDVKKIIDFVFKDRKHEVDKIIITSDGNTRRSCSVALALSANLGCNLDPSSGADYTVYNRLCYTLLTEGIDEYMKKNSRKLRTNADGEPREPLHIELYNNLKLAITSGKMKPCEELPKISELSKEFNIGVIYVLRVYGMLMNDGLVVSNKPKEYTVSYTVSDEKVDIEQKAEKKIHEAISDMHRLGISLEEIQEIVKIIYDNVIEEE